MRLRIDGRLKIVGSGFTTKQDARAQRDRVRTEIRDGVYDPAKYRRRRSGETLDDLLERHTPTKPSNWAGLSERDKRRYWEALRFATWWKERIGQIGIGQLTKSDVTGALNRLDGKGAATINHYHAWLRAALNREIAAERMLVNPAALVAERPEPKAPEFHYTERQELALYRKLSPADADLVRLDLLTAMRRQEIFGLRKEWIVWDRGHLLLPDPKSGRPQFVHLTKEAIGILRRQCRRHQESPWVYPSPRDPDRHLYPGTWYTKVFKPARDRARIPATHKFHTLRHTFPGRLALKGRSDLEIMELARMTPQTVQRYTHHHRENLKTSIEEAFPSVGSIGKSVVNGRSAKRITA